MVTSVLQMFSNIFETDNVHYVYGKIMRDKLLWEIQMGISNNKTNSTKFMEAHHIKIQMKCIFSSVFMLKYIWSL